MPQVLQGLAHFPGVDQILSASYTLSHGVSPSVCQIEILPQADFVAEVGTLAFTFAGRRIAFEGCRIDSVSFRRDELGMVWSLSILDRRWKWAFGEISGSYNERIDSLLPLGTIDAFTLASPRELCTKLLDAMGEKGYDVSQVPDEARPEIFWDRDNPAKALGELAEQFGCRVVLRLDGKVQIARLGRGATLPDADLMHDGLVFDPPTRPDRVKVVCGKTRFQVDFKLEAVAKDLDGKIVPIDELSYKPAQGWGTDSGSSPPMFSSVDGWDTDPTIPPVVLEQVFGHRINPREMAREMVYRWYRISMDAIDGHADGPQIPGWGGYPGKRISEVWQILPIEDVQVFGYYDVASVFHPLPAAVYGKFVMQDFTFVNQDNTSYYDRAFSVDKENGIFIFADDVMKLEDDDAFGEAELYCRVAVSVREHATRKWERFEREKRYAGNLHGTQARIVKREEVQLNVVPVYDINHDVVRLVTTESDCVAECDHALAAVDLEYQTTNPQDRTYMGLAGISPDGAIQQVTWSVGPQGATTRASRNNEWNPAVPAFRERRQFERLGVLAQVAPRLLSKDRKPPQGVR
jgi:hypothetical protein